MPILEIKDFNVLIDNKSLFDQAVKNKQEVYKKFVEMSRNLYYTRGNLLHYFYHQNYYKLIGINLSRNTITTISPEINFKGNLEEDDGAMFCIIIMFFIAEKQQEIF